jgi:N-sulfoglucosamine sulfohydrolase
MSPRNVLLLHCHDLGRFLGTYGVTTVSTPHLDRFADGAVVFEQAFATSPTCSPSRASLFTGAYPQRTGVLGLTHEPFGWDLHDPSTHVAHRLRRHGYRTELVGVHHESLVLPDEQVAARLGFDQVRSGGARDTVVERALEAIESAAHDGRPFYLQAGFHEPHRTPTDRDRPGVMGFLGDGFGPDLRRGHTVPPYLHDDAGAREEIAELQGAVGHMDAGVGAILARLDDLGLTESTVVVFTTDHGLALPGAKCTLYDAGLGVALMARVPGRPDWVGRRVADAVSHVDVLPTLLDVLGLPPVAEAPGTSLVPLVEHGVPARRFTFGQQSHHVYYDPKRSVRSATHKLVVNFGNAPRAMDPTQSWVHRSRPADLRVPTIATSRVIELYDLARDPHELDDLAPGLAEGADPALGATFAELGRALLDWMEETDDPLLTSDPGSARHRLALDTLRTAERVHGPPSARRDVRLMPAHDRK